MVNDEIQKFRSNISKMHKKNVASPKKKNSFLLFEKSINNVVLIAQA